jgi:hypothetical protein
MNLSCLLLITVRCSQAANPCYTAEPNFHCRDRLHPDRADFSAAYIRPTPQTTVFFPEKTLLR